MAIVANYYVITDITESGGQMLLPANPNRTSLTLVSNATIAFGSSVADINGGAGGIVLTSGLQFTFATTEEVWGLVFAPSVDLRILEEVAAV